MTIIVTGAGGMLGKAVVAAAKAVGQACLGFSHDHLDITDVRALEHALPMVPSPFTIINCAGIVKSRDDVPPPLRWNVNAVAPWALAARCDRLVQVSTDCVFDGDPGARYVEDHLPTPNDWYGRSKAAGEISQRPHVTVRGSFIGFDHGLLAWLLAQPKGAYIAGYSNHLWSGTYVADYADALVELSLGDVTGVVHLVGDQTTKAAVLVQLAALLRPDVVVERGPGPDGPRHMNLTSIRTGVPQLPSWHLSLRRLARDHAAMVRAKP